MTMQILFIHVGYLSNADPPGFTNLSENQKTGSEQFLQSSCSDIKMKKMIMTWLVTKIMMTMTKIMMTMTTAMTRITMEVGIISVPTNGGIWCEWSFHSPHPWSSKQSNWDRIQDILKLTACSSTRQLVASYMSQRSRSQILCKSNAFDDLICNIQQILAW